MCAALAKGSPTPGLQHASNWSAQTSEAPFMGCRLQFCRYKTLEFENILEKSGEDGIVVFSMGSMLSEIQMEKAMEIAEGLGTITQTISLRLAGKTCSSPITSNTVYL